MSSAILPFFSTGLESSVHLKPTARRYGSGCLLNQVRIWKWHAPRGYSVQQAPCNTDVPRGPQAGGRCCDELGSIACYLDPSPIPVGPIGVGASQIGPRERELVERVLRSRHLYRHRGGEVAAFERAFSLWLDSGRGPYCLAVNSGSTALTLSLAALGLPSGAEVIIPSYGFVACATAVLAAGAIPVLHPVDRNLGLEVGMLSERIGPKTGAILAVHAHGSSCSIDEIVSIGLAAGVSVIEDVAQVCGGSNGGRPLGTMGVFGCFSFQEFKLITTGEGGLL